MEYPSSVEEIRRIADQAMRPVIGGFESVALVGFPDHSNVGDSAIWLGELAYLRSQSVKVAYSCSSASYRKENLERHTDDDTPILIHGGGYFGDFWRTGLEFLLLLVEDFPDRSIVVMPQTIHFESPRQLERARHIVNGHDSVTICVRDHRSADLAEEYFDHPVVLTPDSSVFLRLVVRRRGSGILYLAREDREAPTGRVPIVGSGAKKADWVDLPAPRMPVRLYASALHRTKSRVSSHVGSADSHAWQERVGALAHDSLARYRLRRGVRLLTCAEVVVTDRLHGHLLSLLLGKPHVLLDNSYGKVRSYYETWSRGIPLVLWASTPGDVPLLLRRARDQPVI